MRVARLGYVRIGLQEPQQWVDFSCGLLGMQEAPRADASGAKFVKIDEHPFRYLVEKQGEDKFLCAGWEMDSADEFAALKSRLQGAGVPVEDGSADEAARRCVAAFASAHDPSGNLFEFYHGRTETGTPYTPQLDVQGFRTGEQGMGHLVLPAAPDQEATCAFYCDVLGFGMSDDLTLPPFAPGMPEQRILFMHAGNPRHHSLGLYNFPLPTGCAHVMAEVHSLDEVGRALDRVKKAGVPLLAGLGRHENDLMVSFYAVGPGGIAVEFGYDGKTIDPDTYQATKSTLGDLWGHEYATPDVG